jgi:hypothetical protein
MSKLLSAYSLRFFASPTAKERFGTGSAADGAWACAMMPSELSMPMVRPSEAI